MDIEQALVLHMPTGSFVVSRVSSYYGFACGTFRADVDSASRLRDMVVCQIPSALSQRLRKFKEDPDFFVCSRVFANNVAEINPLNTLVKTYTRDKHKNVCYAVKGAIVVNVVDEGNNRFGLGVQAPRTTRAMKISEEEYSRRVGARQSLLDSFLDEEL